MKTNKKVKRINIYLSYEEKRKAIEIKNKYHVSISTIAFIVITPTRSLIKNFDTLKVEGGYKTSIKPRNESYTPNMYNVAIKLFLSGKAKEYMTSKQYETYNNMIYKELQNTYEENWNGNYLHRILPRIIKSNPKYIKKVLEEC